MCPCLIEHYGDDKNGGGKLERISERMEKTGINLGERDWQKSEPK